MVLLVLIPSVFLLFQANKSPSQSNSILPSPSPIPIPTNSLPKSIQVLPTIPTDQGGGIDVNSQAVITSEQEIEKLSSALPYNNDVTLSTGLTVSIVIPAREDQDQNLPLLVQIFGINYDTSPDQSDYGLMKNSFREAANDVFDWIKSQGADPSKIYIRWGDRAFIENLAQQWLKE